MKIQKLIFPALFAILSCSTGLALADECSTTINATDAMQFDKTAIVVGKACKKYTVNLAHTGKSAKTVMGHNWVLSKTEDAQPIATDGISAGIDNNYLKAGDTRIIASTKVIGGGETTSVSFPVDKLSKTGSYTFFCSFPGHIAIMKGTLKLE